MSADSSIFPVLLTVSNSTVTGSMRLQNYGFLLHNQHRKDISRLEERFDFKFYDDWEPRHYGPFSKGLEAGLQTCVDDRLVNMDSRNTDGARTMSRYHLSMTGLLRWHSMFEAMPREVKRINDRIARLQRENLYEVIKSIYDKYPESAKNSVIIRAG